MEKNSFWRDLLPSNIIQHTLQTHTLASVVLQLTSFPDNVFSFLPSYSSFVCLFVSPPFRVTGGELFEDIVAREYYSEADARSVSYPFDISECILEMWCEILLVYFGTKCIFKEICTI